MVMHFSHNPEFLKENKPHDAAHLLELLRINLEENHEK